VAASLAVIPRSERKTHEEGRVLALALPQHEDGTDQPDDVPDDGRRGEPLPEAERIDGTMLLRDVEDDFRDTLPAVRERALHD
jgi:hypothetical protein